MLVVQNIQKLLDNICTTFTNLSIIVDTFEKDNDQKFIKVNDT